ncbi:MAG: acyltransferase family protein [Anaerocolumna sp.]
MNLKSKERVLWIDQLRAIGMLFVVLGHVALPKNIIYAFHMPLFFMISGMTHNPRKYVSFIDCAKDKFKKLLLPFVFMNLAMFPVWIVNFKLLRHSKPTLLELLQGLFFINSDKYQTPSNATWFLASLFIVEIIIYLIEKLTDYNKERMAVWVTICGVISYMESINKVQFPMIWHIDSAFSGVVFYFIGYWLIGNYKQILDKIKDNKLKYFGTVLICFMLGVYFSDLNGRVSMNGNVQGSVFYYYVTACLFSISIILTVIKLPIFKYLTYIGRNTLIYLGFHIPLIRLIESTIVDMGYSNGGWIAFFTGIFIYNIMVIVVYYVNNFLPFIVMKPFNEPTKRKWRYGITIASLGIYAYITILVIMKAMEWGRLSLL